MELFLIYPGCRFALPWAMRSLGFQPVTTLKKGQPDHSPGAMRFCAFSATITNMNFRIRIFN